MQVGHTEIYVKNPVDAKDFQEAPSAIVFYTNDLDKTVEELKGRGFSF